MNDDGLPTVTLPPATRTLHILEQLQIVALKHPAAAKALFAALAAEGRDFARTPEGAAWRDRLDRSELLHRARLVLDLPAFSMLASRTPDMLPSGYLDALFTLATSEKSGQLLEPLLRGEWSE